MKTFKNTLFSCVGLSTLTVVLLTSATSAITKAQQSAPVSSTPTAAAAALVSSVSPVRGASSKSVSTTDDRYRIGPGDVLDIRVFNRPQLSREAIRVDGRGNIRMPLLDEEIRAACKTEIELAREVAKQYLKYQRNPHVDVFVKEFNSQPVSVIGAVNTPGRYQLQRRVRLLEILTFSGGPGPKVGGHVKIVRNSDQVTCGEEAAVSEASEDTNVNVGNMLTLSLAETLKGVESANPFIKPGDIVNLPEAEEVYVIGNVLKPTSIPLREKITISRAIAIAGGTMPDTKTDKIRIVRQDSGSSKTELIVDLKAIDRRQAEDIVLRPGDIVDVPASGGKRFLRGILSAIAPAVANTPVRVIR
jgi:polysaccharide export outer membrane protein